jgi:hypothetical protein
LQTFDLGEQRLEMERNMTKITGKLQAKCIPESQLFSLQTKSTTDTVHTMKHGNTETASENNTYTSEEMVVVCLEALGIRRRTLKRGKPLKGVSGMNTRRSKKQSS